jgi:hypothetical protein
MLDDRDEDIRALEATAAAKKERKSLLKREKLGLDRELRKL